MSIRSLLKSPADDWTDLNSNSYTVEKYLRCNPLTPSEKASFNPSDGMMIFDTSFNRFQGYWSGIWHNFFESGTTGTTGATGPTGPTGATGATGSSNITYYQVTDNTLLETNATGFTGMSGLSITPGTGTYMIVFSGNFLLITGSSDYQGYIAIFSNDSIVDYSTRPVEGGAGGSAVRRPVSTNSICSVVGNQSIDIRWYSMYDSITLSCTDRTLDVIKLQ